MASLLQIVRRGQRNIRGGYVLAAALVLAVLLPFGSDEYTTSVFVSVLTFAILALGLNIVVGFAGLLDLGYAAFFAIGAYTTAILTTKFGVNFWLTLPCAVAISGMAGALLGYPTLRLRSDYLAIVTLGFGEMVRLTANNLDFTGGPEGIYPIPPPTFFGHTIQSQADFYYLGLGLLLIIVGFSYWLARSSLGRDWRALRDDEFAAEAVGVPTLNRKLLAYVVGGMWGGLAGSFLAIRLGIVNPVSFVSAQSILIVMAVTIGGLGSLPGAVLGAVLVIGLPELFRDLSQYRLLAFGALVIPLMILRPKGLWPQRIEEIDPFRRLKEFGPAPPKGFNVGVLNRVTESDRPILRVEKLAHDFGGVHAVDDVSFSVLKGEIFGLVGPNGAGKTTIFNCITGVVRARSGTIQLDRTSIRRWTPHRIVASGLARTFQGVRLFAGMTVIDNVLVCIRMEGLWPRLKLHRSNTGNGGERTGALGGLSEAHYWLRFVGVEKYAGRQANELAYADQRRVEIARALASHPQVLLLDEPAAGMNPTEKRKLLETIRAVRNLGITVVLIDHDMGLVMNASDRVAVLDHGKLIALGSPAEVQASPAVIEAYLGATRRD